MSDKFPSAEVDRPSSPIISQEQGKSASTAAGVTSIDRGIEALHLDDKPLSSAPAPSSDPVSVSSVPGPLPSGLSPNTQTTHPSTTPITTKMNYLTLPGTASLSDISSTLQSNGVPTISLSDACAGCAHSDDCNGDEHDEFNLGSYPKKFDIDFESQMSGTTKPYGRQVIISTGLSNWAHEVTEVEGSLAAFISEAHKNLSSSSKNRSAGGGPKGGPGGEKKGGDEPNPILMDTAHSTRLVVMNGSFRSVSDDTEESDEDHEEEESHEGGKTQRHPQTVIVLPDFTFVNGVRERRKDVEQLWQSRLAPGLGRTGKQEVDRDGQTQEGPPEKRPPRNRFETRPLPYDSVILLCSHKRRDNRCGIAAPILEKAITTVLEARGWEAHTQLEVDHSIHSLEERDRQGAFASLDDASREAKFAEEMRQSEGQHGGHGTAGRRALIIKTSHIGGHKFAGNMIVYSPRGTGVWYGRVSPKEVPAVVDKTIIGGKIIPELLRAAVNVSQGQGNSFYDW